MAGRHTAARRRISISPFKTSAGYGARGSTSTFWKRIPASPEYVARGAAQSAARQLHLYYQEYGRREFRVDATNPALQSHCRSDRMRAQTALPAECFYGRTIAA